LLKNVKWPCYFNIFARAQSKTACFYFMKNCKSLRVISLLCAIAFATSCKDVASTSSNEVQKNVQEMPAASSVGTLPPASSTISSVSLQDQLLGTWQISQYLDKSDVASLDKDLAIMGVDEEVTIHGSTTYYKANKYNSDGKITLRVKVEDREVAFNFYYKEAGTWQVVDKTLVETIEGGSITPIDEITQCAINEDPEFAAALTPVRGETTSTEIISINAGLADMQETDSKFKFTMRKKE
jgi:hypothetical protein